MKTRKHMDSITVVLNNLKKQDTEFFIFDKGELMLKGKVFSSCTQLNHRVDSVGHRAWPLSPA